MQLGVTRSAKTETRKRCCVNSSFPFFSGEEAFGGHGFWVVGTIGLEHDPPSGVWRLQQRTGGAHRNCGAAA